MYGVSPVTEVDFSVTVSVSCGQQEANPVFTLQLTLTAADLMAKQMKSSTDRVIIASPGKKF